jgi:hypothetical protein
MPWTGVVKVVERIPGLALFLIQCDLESLIRLAGANRIGLVRDWSDIPVRSVIASESGDEIDPGLNVHSNIDLNLFSGLSQ